LEQKSNRILTLIISCLFSVIFALLVIAVVSQTGVVVKGRENDTMYHVYRGDWILHSVESGDIWPLYNPVWYNGVELLRYWPPAAAYLMAFCQFIARSIPALFPGYYVLEGFSIYCGIIYLIGAITWNIAGYVRNRPFMGIVLGILWFIMPSGLHVLFAEGNLPRSLIMAIFPLAFVFINQYLRKGGLANFIGTALSFLVMCVCHVGYTGMVALACLMYIFVYRLCCFTGSGRLQRSGKRDLELVAGIASGFLLAGIIMFPALRGGLASNTSNAGQAAKKFFQSIFVTLDPVRHFKDGYGRPYFGIVAFLIALFGTVAGKRRSRPGFITALIIILMTTDTASGIIEMLPGGSLMWMLRFLPLATAMILYSMFEWDSLKRPVLVVLSGLLIVDCVFCIFALWPKKEEGDLKRFFDNAAGNTLIDEAKSITVNRIALMDSASPFNNGVFYLTDYEGSRNQLLSFREMLRKKLQ